MPPVAPINLAFESSTHDIAFHVYHNAYPTMHTHNDFWEFIFISKGEILHKINGESRRMKKNTLCILRPFDCHCILQPKNTTSKQFNLSLRTNTLKEFFSMLRCALYEKLVAMPILEFEISDATAERIERAVDTIITTDDAHKIPTMILCLFTIWQEVLAHIITAQDLQQQYSSCTNQFIQLLNNPANLSLSLPQLANTLGYSYSHLNRTFLQETNTSPSQYLKKKRLKYAQELIQYTDSPLSVVSFKVGYSNYSHFSDFFKTSTGITPVEWRKKYKHAHG